MDNPLDTRLITQSIFPKVNGWCQLSWKGKDFCATILALDGDKATIRIFDTEVPFAQWPVSTVSVNELFPVYFEKHTTLEELIASLKKTHKLTTPAIEEALRAVDRSWFCPTTPYFDAAIDIGCEMCISAPHMHVLALELCKERLEKASAILDVGSGSGYLSALFAQLAPRARVVGIEYFAPLLEQSQKTMKAHLSEDLQSRITLLCGDGTKGFKNQAPYTIIYVGFMCKEFPQELLDQLAPGGLLIIPIGNRVSILNPKWLAGELFVVERLEDGSWKQYPLFTCSFVSSM